MNIIPLQLAQKENMSRGKSQTEGTNCRSTMKLLQCLLIAFGWCM